MSVKQGEPQVGRLVRRRWVAGLRLPPSEEAEVYPAVKEKVSDAEGERVKSEQGEAEKTLKRLKQSTASL